MDGKTDSLKLWKMIKIGCLSDTHGYIHDKMLDFFGDVDEIWHAGDIGSVEVIERLSAIKPLRAVSGNIDSLDIRNLVPENIRFEAGGMQVWLTHIGGFPGNYDRLVKKSLIENPPGIFVCGHSHILKVIYDKTLKMLYLNPGAAGKSGFHNLMTALRFKINDKEISDMEVWEMKRG